MANWNGHFILTVFGDFYPALNGDFRPPLTLLHKSDQQRLAAGRENFIFFHCPLDGMQFRGAGAKVKTENQTTGLGPALAISAGMLGYFLAKLSANS